MLALAAIVVTRSIRLYFKRDILQLLPRSELTKTVVHLQITLLLAEDYNPG